VYKKILANANVEMYEGEGKVFDTHTVELTTPDGEVKHFTAKHILIATGGQAVLLNIPGKELAITSDEGLSLESFALQFT